VITNLRQTPRFLDETLYCGRGHIEKRIKELHHGLEIDRTIVRVSGPNNYVVRSVRGIVLHSPARVSTHRRRRSVEPVVMVTEILEWQRMNRVKEEEEVETSHNLRGDRRRLGDGTVRAG
jgi:hypothetical protein